MSVLGWFLKSLSLITAPGSVPYPYLYLIAKEITHKPTPGKPALAYAACPGIPHIS